MNAPILQFVNAEVKAQLHAMGLRHATKSAGAVLVTVACDRKIVRVWALPR